MMTEESVCYEAKNTQHTYAAHLYLRGKKMALSGLPAPPRALRRPRFGRRSVLVGLRLPSFALPTPDSRLNRRLRPPFLTSSTHSAISEPSP